MYDGYYKYDKDIAESYEEARKKEPLWQQEQQFMISFLQKCKAERILDAPVGTGRFLEQYSKTSQIIGIDVSEAMLYEASLKIKHKNLPNVKLQKADIFKLEFPENYFHLTVCWRLIHLIPENMLANALRELGRVTSGELIVQAYVGLPFWERLVKSAQRWPAKVCRRLFFKNHEKRSAWSHICGYYHAENILLGAIADANLKIGSWSNIGNYGDSKVIAYHLTK